MGLLALVGVGKRCRCGRRRRGSGSIPRPILYWSTPSSRMGHGGLGHRALRGLAPGWGSGRRKPVACPDTPVSAGRLVGVGSICKLADCRVGCGGAALLALLTWDIAVGLGLLAAIGAAAGLTQWLVLRRQLPGAGWWALASAVAWAVGAVVLLAVAWVVLGVVPDIWMAFLAAPVAGWAAGTLAGAAVTGVAVFWLLPVPPDRRVRPMAYRRLAPGEVERWAE